MRPLDLLLGKGDAIGPSQGAVPARFQLFVGKTRSDPQQLAFCMEYDRVLITNDADFHELLKETPDHPGVIFWIKKKHFGQLVKDIDHLCMTMTAEDFWDRVFYL